MKLYLYKGKINYKKVNFGENNTRKVNFGEIKVEKYGNIYV